MGVSIGQGELADLRQDFNGEGGEGERWYVVMAQPRGEDVALLNLQRQGFDTFLPKRLETRAARRGFESRLRPIFPRYLFVALDLDVHRWRSVNGTFGVSRLLSFGERPTPLPRGVAESLRSSVDVSGAVRFERPLVPGEVVRLLRGPFADRLGILESLDDRGRVRLLLDLLGGKVILTLSSDGVEPVDRQRSA